MPIAEDQDHSISLEEAAKLTRNYRDSISPDETISVAFGKNAIEEIIKQDGCVGLRMYYARTDEGQLILVLVGVDSAGDDLKGGRLAEWGSICPPECPSPNELNS